MEITKVVELLDTVETVLLSENRLAVKCSEQAYKDGILVHAGSQEIPLYPLAGTDTWLNWLNLEQLLPAYSVGVTATALKETGPTPSKPPLARINAMLDWGIAGGRTLQIGINDPQTPQLIMCDVVADLPADRGPRLFQVFAAAHRASSSVRLVMTNTETHESKFIDTVVPDAIVGGTTSDKFHTIRVSIPETGAPTRIQFGMVFLSSTDAHSTDAPYLFASNPSITKLVQPTALRKPYGLVKGSTWYSADLPQMHTPNARVSIALNGSEETIFNPGSINVKLHEDYGHTVMISSSKADNYLLYTNGICHSQIYLSPTSSAVRIPTDFLTGDVLTLEIRDHSGSISYLKEYILTRRLLTPESVLWSESKAPFTGQLTGQAYHRYQSLQAQLNNPGSPEELTQASYALSVLEGGYDNVKLKPLAFPEVKSPDVSIVIPAHNKVAVTYYGLASLLLAKNKASFEVILVDDASTDETSHLEDIVSGITVIHNETAQRFIRACNAGAAVARGEYIVMLNNDIEATAGWLDQLIDGFNRFDNVGLVGSKLLYPDGKLQDAGGIVWGSGNPWNYGNRQNAWDPRFTYARQADYLTGAAMMTSKKIWDEVGGLSNYLEPMYFEDTDFSFKIRDAGYTTWFIPSSIVYHFEGMTSGTDTSSGFKRYQEVNRPKFKRKWAEAYKHFGAEGQNPDLAKDRGIKGRVLFIDYATPREDRDAGSYAAIQEIRLVQSLGYKVTFLPQNLAHIGEYTEILERMGVEVIVAPFYLSLQEFLEERITEFDAAYITRYYVAQDTAHIIRTLSPRTKILMNNADLHFLRELRAALASGDETQLAGAAATREQELAMMRQSDVVLSYNEVEHSVITSHTEGQVKVMTCPWVVDVPKKVPGISKRTGMSFLGSFKHHPNAEGVLWFAREVMPLLEKSNLKLSIYGSGMNDEIRALESETVDPVGFVQDIADAYDQHRIFIAPLLSGAGIKGKVLSALAHGIPMVLTSVAAEGIGLRHKHDCFIVERPQDWATAIETLENDNKLWSKISQNARSYAMDTFSFESGKAKMQAAFEAVDMY